MARTQTRYMAAVLFLFTTGAVVGLCYWYIGSPQYSVRKMLKAYRQRDYKVFQQYFDVEGIANRAAEQFRQEREKDPEDHSSDSEKQYWSQQVRQTVLEYYRLAFTGEKQSASVHWLEDASIVRVSRSSERGTVVLQSRFDRVTLEMIPVSGRRWGVVSVSNTEYVMPTWR